MTQQQCRHLLFLLLLLPLLLQVNQVKGLYVEDSDIFGSAPNGVALDGVAVQYGHVCRSNIHHADWCMYLKGEVQLSQLCDINNSQRWLPVRSLKTEPSLYGVA